MKKVIFAAFMLLAVAGTTMAQTAKKDTASATSATKHTTKKHHHSSTSTKKDAAPKSQKQFQMIAFLSLNKNATSLCGVFILKKNRSQGAGTLPH